MSSTYHNLLKEDLIDFSKTVKPLDYLISRVLGVLGTHHHPVTIDLPLLPYDDMQYNLSRVKAPTVFFSAGQDVLSSPQDTDMTRGILSQAGSLVEQKQLQDYGHMVREGYGVLTSVLLRHVVLELNSALSHIT
jgi:hypothetical protein